jgi:hypothetical protein
MRNLMYFSPIIHGGWCPLVQAELLLIVIELTRLSVRPMVPLIDTRLN